MRILLVNQQWFKEELRAEGHEVTTIGLASHLDFVPPAPLMSIDSIIEEYLGGKRPDLILIHDNSAPVWIMGLEHCDIPVLFYSVDAHHHAELHAYLANVFDHLLVAQRDYIEGMKLVGHAPMEWMPLWASRYVEPTDEREHEVVFIGQLNPDLNPDRVEFFEALNKEVPVFCKVGKWWEYFPKSEIVMNQTVKGDLNFRVFEAMMCGTMLLTEKSPNGLFELFEDGVHLVTYKKGDVQEAAEKIRYYLEHKEECAAIGRRGREEIMAKHLYKHRAERVIALCEEIAGGKREWPNRYFSWMVNCAGLASRLQKLDTELARQAWIYAIKAADSAVRNGEEMTESLSFRFVNTCSQFDRMNGLNSGAELMEAALEQYSDIPLLALAVMRRYLNTGRRDEAEALAQAHWPTEEVSTTFRNAEEVITALIQDGSVESAQPQELPST